ncbi:MAG: CapA family protein [Ruminococcus sp.]|nr:CapA family protein [Ruminococcus sp.]
MKINHGSSLRAAGLAVTLSLFLASCGTPIADNPNIENHEKSVLSRLDDASSFTFEELNSADDSTADISSPSDNSTPDESEEPSVPTTGTTKVHLACAGDNLIHDNIYMDAQKEDGSYDFSKCYAPCKKLIEGADIAILNQETLVNDAFPPSTYPVFSTPTECGDAVVDFGFNVISMSNNHVLDKGSVGLISSLDYWDTKDVVHYGAYRSEEDANDIKTMEVNGITFAFLGYMEYTNGLYLDDDEPGKVIYLSEEDVIKRQVEEADKIADVVVVSCHFGTEIYNEINTMQITMSEKLVEWGADLIIGTQAHALSTCRYLDKPDGGQAFVYYGLGNFLHTMYDARNPDGLNGKSLVGIFGTLDIIKDYATGEITIENVKAIPVISHYEGESYDTMWYNCAVYPYADYTDELLEKHIMHWRSGIGRSDFERSISYIPEEFLAWE